MKVKGIIVFILMASFIGVAMAGIVSAKSVYVIGDIAGSPTPIQAYDIQTAPNYLVYQTTHGVPRYAGGAVGLAIDTDSEILFITYENSNTIQLVDAKTMTDEGSTTAPNANNLAGIVVDQDKQKVYTVDRGTDNLYVYSWDATTKTLTLDFQTDLSGVTNAHGLALDEVNNLLYVGDMVSTNNIVVFSTDDWSSVTSYTVSELVQGIAVDVKNGYIYAGNSGWYGGDRLCKYDMNSNTETYVEITTLNPAEPDAAVQGLAVDPDNSLLYVTTGNQGSEGRVYDDWDCILVLDSDLNLLYNTGDIGNPTGICVPGKDISYNPLNLAKNDVAADCGVYEGLTFTYEITCDNNDNTFDVTGVTITDNLPVELDFVSATVGGIYDDPTHTVTWDIGTILAGQTGPLVELEVRVNQNAIPNTTIYNHCKIESNETPPTTKIGVDPDCPPGPPGTPIIPVPYICYPDLPAPQLVFEGTEDYEVGGNWFTRYLLTVTNWADYPDELFELSPDLPACGLNTNSSRSWVDIFTADNSRIYGFCALGVSTNLQNIWFAVPRGDCPPEQIYIEIYDRRCDINYTSNLVPIIGDIFGVVSADCPAPGTRLLGVEIDLYNAGGDLVANAITDVDGYYEMLCVLVGDYTITIVTPLGYQIPNDELPVTVTGDVVTVDFALTCVEITAEPRTIGFWKHQTGVATGGKGSAQIDALTLCEYLDLIEGHFNGNAINQVIIYQPPGTDVCDDKLLALKSLMNLKGSVDMIDRAKQQLMALLLNVASGKLSQTEVISADGATVSQAITYCDNLVDDPAGDHETAKTICDEINNNRQVAAGVIPLTTQNIAYRVGTVPTEFALSQNYPNPFNPVTQISYALPRDGHVKLQIYNLLGHKVATLVDEYQQAGQNTVNWEAKDIASGIYFYKLSSGDFTATKKMLLTK